MSLSSARPSLLVFSVGMVSVGEAVAELFSLVASLAFFEALRVPMAMRLSAGGHGAQAGSTLPASRVGRAHAPTWTPLAGTPAPLTAEPTLLAAEPTLLAAEPTLLAAEPTLLAGLGDRLAGVGDRVAGVGDRVAGAVHKTRSRIIQSRILVRASQAR